MFAVTNNIRKFPFILESVQYKWLIQKGIYPYEYMDNWDKFEETNLPPKEAFYSKLNVAGVKEEDYEHALKVWKEFRLKNWVNIMIYILRQMLSY